MIGGCQGGDSLDRITAEGELVDVTRNGPTTYYLEKTEDRSAIAKRPSGTTQSGSSRKEERRQEAELRNKRNKTLNPLEIELGQLETTIAELEQAQATLTEHLSTPEVSGDPDKLHQTSLAVQQVTEKLETAYSRWAELSDEIETLRDKLK